MDVIFDILEFLSVGIWIILVIFGSKIFKKKNEETNYEYPSFPEESEQYENSNANTNVKTEEEKLKEWLENVFGKSLPKEPVPDIKHHSEEQVVYSETSFDGMDTVYMDEVDMEPVRMCTDRDYQDRMSVPVYEESTVDTSVMHDTTNSWNGKLGKNQMAYGMVMAEIFSKPRALNPLKPIFYKNK